MGDIETNEQEPAEIETEPAPAETEKREFITFPGMENRYNAAAWCVEREGGGRSTCMIAREVVRAAEMGQPDVGQLVYLEFDENHQLLHENVIWQPAEDQLDNFLEDPRVLYDPLGGRIVIGLTVVKRVPNSDGVTDNFVPYPASMIIESTDDLRQPGYVLPEPSIIGELNPGADTTPVGELRIEGKNMTALDAGTFVYRPEGDDNNHRLLVFHEDKGRTVVSAQSLNFPTDIPWAKFRIGTTMPPIWLNDTEAIFLFHGITVQEHEGANKFIYSIGSAKMTREGDTYAISDINYEPLITPDDFTNEDGSSLYRELHPEERRVVYSCGGYPEKIQRPDGSEEDGYVVLTNVGDSVTVGVPIALSEITANWQSDQPAAFEQAA